MKERLERRSKGYGFNETILPTFTDTEIARIKGTYDYFGINCYSGALVRAGNTSTDTIGLYADLEADIFVPSDWPVQGSMRVTFYVVCIYLKRAQNTKALSCVADLQAMLSL